MRALRSERCAIEIGFASVCPSLCGALELCVKIYRIYSIYITQALAVFRKCPKLRDYWLLNWLSIFLQHISDVGLWMAFFCFRMIIDKLPVTHWDTSLLHDSSRCRQTKQDTVRKARLLSGRPRHMEQSPHHHPYHRLPPSLSSCPQDTSVPLSV